MFRSFLAIGTGVALLAAALMPITTIEAQAQGDAPAGGGKPLVKITQAMVAKDINFLPWYIAAAKGYFAEEGLDVSMPSMTAQVAIPALMSKQVEFAIAATSARAAYQGAPVRIVMYGYDHFPLLGVASPEVKSFSDLSGKVVATSSIGASDELMVRALLDKNHVTDYKLIPLGAPAARASALIGGQVQYTLIDPLTVYRLARDNGANLLGSAENVYVLPSSGFAVLQDTLVERPEVVRAWMRATIKALMFEKTDTAAAAVVAATILDIDQPLALKSLTEVVKYIDANDPGGADEATLTQIVVNDFAQTKTSGDAPSMAKKVHDFTILHEAQRDLGIKCTHGYECR